MSSLTMMNKAKNEEVQPKHGRFHDICVNLNNEKMRYFYSWYFTKRPGNGVSPFQTAKNDGANCQNKIKKIMPIPFLKKNFTILYEFYRLNNIS